MPGPSQHDPHKIGGIFGVQFRHDARAMCLNGAFADAKMMRGLPIGGGIDNPIQHLCFALCQVLSKYKLRDFRHVDILKFTSFDHIRFHDQTMTNEPSSKPAIPFRDGSYNLCWLSRTINDRRLCEGLPDLSDRAEFIAEVRGMMMLSCQCKCLVTSGGTAAINAPWALGGRYPRPTSDTEPDTPG